MATYRNLSKIAQKNPRLHLHFSHTISQFNMGHFPSFFQDISRKLKIGIEKFSINFENQGFFFQTRGSSLSENLNLEKIKEDVDFILDQNRFRLGKDIFDLGKIFFRRFYLKKFLRFAQNPNKMVLLCPATVNTLFLDPYGNLYPCILWQNYLGNIKKMNFERFWSSKKLEEAREDILRQRCPICFNPCEAQTTFLENLPLSLFDV